MKKFKYEDLTDEEKFYFNCFGTVPFRYSWPIPVTAGIILLVCISAILFMLYA